MASNAITVNEYLQNKYFSTYYRSISIETLSLIKYIYKLFATIRICYYKQDVNDYFDF